MKDVDRDWQMSIMVGLFSALAACGFLWLMGAFAKEPDPPAHRCAAPIVAGPRVVTCEAFEVRTCHQIGKQWACSPWVAEFEQPLWNRGVR